MRRNHRRLAATLMASAALGAAGHATAETDVGGQLTVTTDYMFLGVSQTMSGAALQGELWIEGDRGWYGYVWGSNVDFTDSVTPDDGASFELNVGAGYSRAISDSLSVSLTVHSYLYPNTEPGIDYDYVEWQGAFNLSDRHELVVGYSDNVFGSDSVGVYYVGRTGFEMTEHFNIGIEYGHYDLNEGFDISYDYAELSVSGELELVEWRLAYFTTGDVPEEIFYASTVSDRLVFSLTLPF